MVLIDRFSEKLNNKNQEFSLRVLESPYPFDIEMNCAVLVAFKDRRVQNRTSLKDPKYLISGLRALSDHFL